MSASVTLNNVTKQFGEVVAVDNISLEIENGEFFSLLGPSGCGKTTTLRLVAGFEQPSTGEIEIMGQPVAGVPAYKRPVNTVFQSYALFPHMSVAQNVAFGLEMSKVPKAEIGRRVDEALELVQMGTYHQRKPAQLSGGQKQRIALARALVNRPRVLLLDEPLGALDLKLRKAMQLELKEIQSEVGITFVYVTHDQEEAITMSDRIAVMNNGHIQQIGTSRDIYEHPTNRFVADFIGETNFMEGEVVESKDDITTLVSKGLYFAGKSHQTLTRNQKATLAIRPEKIGLFPLETQREGESESPNGQVTLSGIVADVIYIGTDTRYQIEVGTGDKLFVRVQNFGLGQTLNFKKGDPVSVRWLTENAQVLTE